MYRKAIIVLVAVAACVVFSGCQVGYVNSYGFGNTMPSFLVTDQTRGTFMLPKAESLAGVQVLGKVEGKATARNTLMLIAEGNCGIDAAKRDALRNYPEADDIINVEVDTHHKSTLGLINESTTILRGIAIKYKK